MCRRALRAAVQSATIPTSSICSLQSAILMSYQVIARKWRPQQFDDVVGQQAVTRTLRNALASGRLAQAFVFAGPRGVGKTTTARILARALNCVKGPTADPCGVCDACVEIAEGRDIDVLEIDAATHTGVDNVREVIISGLVDRAGAQPLQDLHHRRSPPAVERTSFNALLKSIEEPPPHVVFMMATTELDKIPETVLSRSQVYEFRTISTKAIADQLRHDRRRRGHHGRRRGAAADRARRRRQHARRAEQARSGDRVHRQRRSRPTTCRRCSAWSAATCCSTRCRPWPTRTRRRRSRWPAAPSRWATTCAPSAASCRGWCATCWCCRSIRRASTIRRSPAKASATG